MNVDTEYLDCLVLVKSAVVVTRATINFILIKSNEKPFHTSPNHVRVTTPFSALPHHLTRVKPDYPRVASYGPVLGSILQVSN